MVALTMLTYTDRLLFTGIQLIKAKLTMSNLLSASIVDLFEAGCLPNHQTRYSVTVDLVKDIDEKLSRRFKCTIVISDDKTHLRDVIVRYGKFDYEAEESAWKCLLNVKFPS